MDDFRLRAGAARDGDAVREAVAGFLKGVWTALPSIIKTDSDGHIATANSAINMPVVGLNGTISMVPFPDLDTSPVHYPGGGGVTHTHPVKKGDEGVVFFTSRAQDLWHQKGGVQDPIDNRSHHLADSRWIPGGRSDPRKMSPAPSTTSQQNRSDDGNHVVDVHPQNGVTHSSTQKVLANVGGANGTGTLHLIDKILKNAPKVLINCIKQDNFPPPGNSFANKKLIATKPVGAMGNSSSAISGIMSQVMSGGLASIMANPLSAAGGSLTSAITGAVGQVTAALGGSGAAGIVSALTGSGGLSSALSGLMGGAAALSGSATPTAGQYGLTDLLNHATSLTQFFGDDVPPAVALSTVTAPLQGSTVAGVETQMQAIVAAVVAGSMTPAAGAAAILALATALAGLMPASATAIATLQAAIPAMTLAQAAASAMISLDPNEAAVGGALGGVGVATLAAAMNQLFTPSAADTAAILSFPDGTATQAGAMGGFAAS